jgi:hypothetical protein
MNLISAALLLSCLPTALINFALPQWKADKNTRIEDAYKWTYQATRGGEHAIPDKQSAKQWLDNEWQTLDAPLAGEPLWQPLCKDAAIGRLNMRPYRAGGGKPDELLEAFLTSSRDYRSDGLNFVSAWMELGRRIKKRPAGKLNYKAWARLDTETRAKNYPAIHHSGVYEKTEHPAYRILTLAEMKKIVP